MSFFNLRAVWEVSNSTSMTTLPAAMCKPPAKRSSDETSALRQQGLVTDRRLSSSFTDAVIAMGLSNQDFLLNVCKKGG